MHARLIETNEAQMTTNDIVRRTKTRVIIAFSLFAVLNSLLPAVAAPAPSVRAEEAARIELVRRLSPSVASLFTKSNHAGGGSGVIIDPEGYGLTNFHVVAEMFPDRVGDAGLLDGTLRDIEVLGIDPTGDVAMFRFTPKETYTAAPLGDSDSIRVGDGCLALGNPFGLSDDYSPTVTLGIISGLHRYQAGTRGALTYSDCIQVDTSINPGNSGGPLFDMGGRLIGINGRVAIEERGRVNVGVGFAITINQIKRFIPALRAGLAPAHGTAGIIAGDREAYVVVDQLEEGSAAYRAGVRSGDRLLRFAGQEIQSANQFLSIIGALPAGWPVELEYRRLDKVEKKNIRLDALPLPDLTGRRRGPHAKSVDPYAPTESTDRANQRSVKRAMKAFIGSLGGRAAVETVHAIRSSGRKTLASKPADSPTPFDLSRTRPGDIRVRATDPPDDIEGTLWWALMSEDRDQHSKVIGGDEVGGRIAVVIEKKIDDGFSFNASFDDENGRLLALEFTPPALKKRARYEYSDDRPAGQIQLPYLRRIYLDDALIAEDHFDTLQAQEKPQ